MKSNFDEIAFFFQNQIFNHQSFLMKLSFSKNQIFNKKQNLYASVFLGFCLTPFIAEIHVLP